MNNAPSLATEAVHAKEGDIRLNLGGRDSRIEGFLNVDLKDGSTTDIKTDCSNLSMFANETVSEIYASNILEHFPHPKTIDVLKEWKRVLKSRGSLWISVPDLDAAIKLYEKYGMNDFIRNLLYGDQIYDLAYHYTGFTFGTLADACMKAGFSDIRRLTWLPFRINDCSRNVDSRTGRSVMINAEVIA